MAVALYSSFIGMAVMNVRVAKIFLYYYMNDDRRYCTDGMSPDPKW